MNKISITWVALVILSRLAPVADAETRPNLETLWLHAVSTGIERYASANGGVLPTTWEEIASQNPREIQGATKMFEKVNGYNPLQVYGLLSNAVPLPMEPSHLIIMVRTKEIVDTWKNANGQRESIAYRYIVFRDDERKVRSDVKFEADLASIKSAIDAVEPLKASEAGFSEEQSRAHAALERQARASEKAAGDAAPREANARGAGGHTRRASYALAGLIGILSAAFGGLITWALSRRSAANE